MVSPAYVRELNQHCEAVMAVLAAAGAPGLLPPHGAAHDAWVLLRPTMQVLGVPRSQQRWVEAEVVDDPERWFLSEAPATHRRYLFAELSPLLLIAAYRGRAQHQVCLDYRRWHMDVLHALGRHGWYDPATNHTPPPDRQLDALERREEHRDRWNAILPGMGDAAAGQLPSTAEGRRLVWYRMVDEDGQEHWINGADVPTNDEDDAYL